MKHIFFQKHGFHSGIHVALLLALFLFIGCQAPAVESFTEADSAAITESVENWQAAVLDGRWSDVVANYSEDAILMPPNQPDVVSRASIQAWFEAFPPINDIQLQNLEIDGDGDMAYVYGSFEMTFTPEGMDPVSDSGTFLEVRRHQADGSWLITRDMFNSSLPLPMPE
ncbi:MAG: DUF4440 domain-containing protein [Bacteroidetes bacterium]|nr:DUF4440 domain-containing protein [Bacteroidota bacterium]